MRRKDGGISRGAKRAPSLTSVLPPKAQHKQGLLTPPATNLSGYHGADGTQLFPPRFVSRNLLFLRKRHTGAFPLLFASPTTQQRHPSRVRVDEQTTGSSRWKDTQLIWEDTRLCHTAPALAGRPPGHAGPRFGPWPELLPSPGRLSVCWIPIIYGLGDGKQYQTHTLHHHELIWMPGACFLTELLRI